jgi:hypothetical protein
MKRGRAIAAASMIIALLASSTLYATHSDIAFSPAVPRYGGQVTEIGASDGKGGVHRFRARQVGPYYAPAHFPPGAMRGWRLTFVGGEGITKTFEVVSNTDHEFVVKALDVPFDGVAVNDMFLVEDIKSAEPIK